LAIAKRPDLEANAPAEKQFARGRTKNSTSSTGHGFDAPSLRSVGQSYPFFLGSDFSTSSSQCCGATLVARPECAVNCPKIKRMVQRQFPDLVSDADVKANVVIACIVSAELSDQRTRATDIRHGTETQSRGRLHPACSAVQRSSTQKSPVRLCSKNSVTNGLVIALGT